MWIEIFKAGKQTDSQGRKRDFTADDLDKIVTSYNPAQHEAPVVIGHPKENAPAWGWVEGLKREGNTIKAKLKDLVPEFVDMVKRGMFKKRSISLYPDLSLRHVGFLGAMPPAVKGLADIQFNQFNADEATEYEFLENEKPLEKEGKKMTFKEWLTNLKNMFNNFPDDLPAGEMPKTFSEADVAAQVEKAKKEAEAKTRQKMELEFAEQGRQKRQEGLKTEISTWCESMVKSGKITPAWVKFGLPELLFAAASSEEIMEFGEEKTKTDPLTRWKELFEKQIPAVVDFKEVATRGKDSGAGSAGEKLTVLANKKLEADKSLSFSQAFAVAQIENIALAQEYAQEIRGGK